MTNQPRLRILYTGADPSGEVDTRELTPLVHVHIPKCAGTTLDHVIMGLAKACSRPGIRFRGTIYGQAFSGTEREEAWKKAEGSHYPIGWLYASGHIPYGHFPYHGGAADEVSIIRDPPSRLISMFRMGVKRGAWKATTPVKDLFDAGLFAPDSMVRQLCGERSRDRALDDRDVETAVGNFQRMKYAGRIEEFGAILGAILAAYRIPYIAYHNFQVGEPGRDQERDRLTEAFAPYMRLDKAFFDLAATNRRVSRQMQEISITDVAPSAAVLLASPLIVPENGMDIQSAFVSVESITDI